MGGSAADLRFDHIVDIYAREADLIVRVSGYLSEALERGGSALVVATEAHRSELASAFHSRGLPVSELRDSGTLVELDAASTLARISVGGEPDRSAFLAVLRSRILELSRPVHVYGEMVALLWQAGLITSTLELERYWNELGSTVPFSLYCSYPIDIASDRECAEQIAAVCGLHSETRGEASPSTHGWTSRVEHTFDPTIDAPRRARRLVRDTLETFSEDEGELGDAELVVTELVTNAIRHARSAHRVEISARRARVRIVVEDADRTLPFAVTVPHDHPSGRGLAIVAALSDTWGYQRTDQGKVVWAELRLRTR